MKNLIEPVKAYLKKVFSDLHNAVVGAIVATVILSGGGIYIFAQNLWTKLKNIAQLPTPLWATITGILFLLVYTRVAQFQAKTSETDQSSKSPPDEDKLVKSLSEESINVLKTISETEEWIAKENLTRTKAIDKADFLNSDWLSIKLKTSTQKIQYHFDQLNTAKLIHFYPNREMSGTTPKGRALLHEKGLLA